MVSINNTLCSLESKIISNIKDVQSRNLKIQNICFDVDTIEDSKGNVFVRVQPSKESEGNE